jgi:hypothetical protein
MTIPENTGDFATEFKDFLDCFVVVVTSREFSYHYQD